MSVCVRRGYGLFYMYSQLTQMRTAKGWQPTPGRTHRELSFSACTQSCEWICFMRLFVPRVGTGESSSFMHLISLGQMCMLML